MHQFSLTRK